MNFLIDANLPRSSKAVFLRHGHQVVDVRDVLPRGAADARIAQYAKENQRVLVTRDFDFADIRNYPPENYPGLVVLDLPDDAIASTINKALESFINQNELLARLPGRLAIVETWRVRFRPV